MYTLHIIKNNTFTMLKTGDKLQAYQWFNEAILEGSQVLLTDYRWRTLGYFNWV